MGVVERQTRNEESGTVGEVDVQVAKVLVSAIEGICARTNKLLWDAPCSLCLTQSYTVHITHFVFRHFGDTSLYKMGKASPYSRWPE